MIAYFYRYDPRKNENINFEKVDLGAKASATGHSTGLYVAVDPTTNELIKEWITNSHVYRHSESYIDPFLDSSTVFMDLRAPLPPDMRKENNYDNNMFSIGVAPIKKGRRYKIRESAYDSAVQRIKSRVDQTSS